MGSFGLGLVLNFVDNASAGIGNATRAFQQMSQTADAVSTSVSTSITDIMSASYALDSIGTTLMDTGTSILNVYAGMSRSVIEAGTEMQGYRMQLSALYGSVEAGEEKIREIKDYAMSSVFDIQSLIPAVTTMKAVGIEAMQDITTSSGQHTQKLLDYASDLAAMVPNMRNTYGTGVQAAMGALKEYIAEGNALSLKRGAGLDITQILGEDKGSSIEERTQQIADLIEKLNIVGYTANLSGTPTQRLSNMQDALFNSLTKIADSGVFDKYCDLLEKLSNWVFSLVENEETFNTITGILADTVTAFLSPLESLLDFIIENTNAIIDWAKEHPELTKKILLTVAAVGALLVVGGALLRLLSSIGMAMVGLSFLKGVPAILSTVMTSILPVVAIAGTLYIAWKKNLFGIRDTVKQVLKEIATVWSLTFDALGDNTLSEEDFLKARDLGILPFIESILDLKYLISEFFGGFKTGFNSVFSFLDKFVGKISDVEGSVYDVTGKIGEFLKKIFNVEDDADIWSKVGEFIGKIAGALTVAIPIVFTAVKAFKLIGAAIGLISSPVGLIVTAIGLVVAGVLAFKKAWDENLGGIQDKGREVFESILGFYDVYISPLVTKIGEFANSIIDIFVNLWNEWLKPVFSEIWDFLVRFWNDTLQPLFADIGEFFGPLLRFLGMVLNLLLDLWNNVLAPLISWIVDVLAPVVTNVVSSVLNIIEVLGNAIGEIVGGVLDILGGLLDFITGVFTGDWDLAWQGILDIFTGIWDTLVAVVKGVINAIILVINTLISLVYSVVAAVVNGLGDIVGGVGDLLGVDIGFSIPEDPPQIPYLAEGGKVTDAVTAVIGEGEDEEVVLPLNDDVFNELAKGINNSSNGNSSSNSPIPVQNDYSVTFAAGSVVIQLVNATDAELERAAEKLMKIIERKQQLKAMAVRA